MNSVVDFALIPLQPNSDLRFFSGASSTVIGSGSIGSTLLIKNLPMSGSFVNLEWGSFQNFQANYGAGMQKDRLSFSLNMYYKSAKNNFNYKYNGQVFENKNADQEILGLNARLAYQLNESSKLEFFYWKQDADREIPPSKSAVNTEAKQKDIFNKYIIRFNHLQANNEWQLQLNYAKDRLLFDDITIEPSDSYVQRLQLDGFWKYKRNYTIGIQGILDYADATLFSETFSRSQVALFATQQFSLNRSWDLLLSERINWLNTEKLPFTFSAKIEHKLSSEHSINIELERIYNLPGFNDLFWPVLGNPDLLPERGFAFNVGSNYKKYFKQNTLFDLHANLFYNRLRDWIVWVPNEFNVWRPENARKLRTYGLELRLTFRKDYKFASW
ncbi:MAG: TonB-dependent receptor, partial [Bacteroidota bacterium]